ERFHRLGDSLGEGTAENTHDTLQIRLGVLPSIEALEAQLARSLESRLGLLAGWWHSTRLMTLWLRGERPTDPPMQRLADVKDVGARMYCHGFRALAFACSGDVDRAERELDAKSPVEGTRAEDLLLGVRGLFLAVRAEIAWRRGDRQRAVALA